MSKHFFGEREVQKLHKSCQNGTKLSQNAVYPDGEAVYRPAQDQVNHVKSMYIFCIQTTQTSAMVYISQDQVVFLMIEPAVRSTVRSSSSCSNNSSTVRFSQQTYQQFMQQQQQRMVWFSQQYVLAVHAATTAVWLGRIHSECQNLLVHILVFLIKITLWISNFVRNNLQWYLFFRTKSNSDLVLLTVSNSD